MTKTLILLFYRKLTDSKANAAFFRAARTIDAVESFDMKARYRDGNTDMHSAAATSTMEPEYI
tara:strand:+ start:744 stop:932 length:189 start_codon:yes stop_codon:yes gene_type:complete